MNINIVFKCRAAAPREFGLTDHQLELPVELQFCISITIARITKLFFYFLKDMSAKMFLLVYILIKQFMIQSYLVSTSQHGCTGVGCHQTIGTSGTVGHVISNHQSGSQAVPLKTPHHPVSLVQITHVSGSNGTIS